MSLESGSSKTEKNKTNAKKRSQKMTRKKMKVNKPKSNTPKCSKNERNERDPDYAPKSCHNYVKLTSNELINSTANSVRIYDETGSVVVSDEEDVLPCRNEYKRKPKNKNLSNQRGPQVCGTKFGQGSGGFPFSFDVSMCIDDSSYHSLNILDNVRALNHRAMPSTSTNGTSTRIGSILDNSDITHLDRSNITIRTPQSKRVKEAGHITIPSSSKPKVPINQNEESNFMNFVDFVVADVDTPSTSRTTRTTNTRKRASQNSTSGPPTKRNKNKNAAELQSVSETAPSATCVNPDSLVTTENESSASLGNCKICFESLANKNISSTICGHVFCTQCIVAAIKVQNSCPQCRKRLTLKKIHPIFI